MGTWDKIKQAIIQTAETNEETSGSQRFRDTVAEANVNPKQATKIYLNAAKDRAKETAAAVAIPLAGGAAGPIVTDLATGAFVADGLYNLASGNGVQKTVQLAQQRDIQGTVKSAIGDALNLFALYPGLKLGKSAFTRFKNNLSIVSEPGFYYHGSPKTNITTFRPGKDGGIYWTSDAKAASGYTGIGTGKVYKSKLDPGSNPIEIDVGEDYWTRIPEEKVTNAFGLPKEEVYKQIGSYNLGIRPWYEDFLIPFGYKPKKYPYYAIDQIVKLGNKNKVTSINFKNAKDTGKGLISVFSKPKIYDQFVVYNPNQIHLQKQGGILKGRDGFKTFLESLPKNQQDTTNFNVRRYWELNGKPKNFYQAWAQGMYTFNPSDRMYHANSIAYNSDKDEYEFMKSPNHPTIQLELDAYNNNEQFKKDYQLDTTQTPWKYIRRK